MTQDKLNRVIVACVSAATALLVFLLGFLVYQWIAIANLNKKIEKAEAEVAYWQEQVDTNSDRVTDFESLEYLEWALDDLKILEGKK
jgi:cell division protein FtsB